MEKLVFKNLSCVFTSYQKQTNKQTRNKTNKWEITLFLKILWEETTSQEVAPVCPNHPC